MEFSGKISKLYAYKQNNGWCAGIITQEDGESIKFSGIIPGACEGYLIEGTGEISIDPKYGEQLKVETAKLGQPISRDGIIKALTSYDGIGPSLAERIYDKFTKNSLKIVQKDPDKLADISGISAGKIEKIKNTVNIDLEIQKIVVGTNGNITENMARKVLSVWGKNALKRITETPYDLIKDFNGIGFKTADKIAKALSLSPTDPQRIRAALVYILHEEHNKNGHMYLTSPYLQAELLKLIADFSHIKLSSTKKQNIFEKYMTEELEDYINDKDEINKKLGLTESEIEYVNNWVDIALDLVDNLADIIAKAQEDNEVFVDENQNIYYKFDYDAEYFAANIIGTMSMMPSVKKIDPLDIVRIIAEQEAESGYELGKEQKDAINTSLRSRISIITGGPGRGKTTIINTILKIWNDDENVVLCAPTGRAAQRMKDQTGHDASTIHSLIYVNSYIPHNKKLFIVDESSMLDINLAADLLYLISKGDNNIIFIGDADQLPSVGAGNFFNDLISSKAIPTTFLKTGYRNFGNIADNAFKINHGNGFSKMKLGEDFNFVETDHEPLQQAVLEDYEKLLTKYEPKEICLLSPMRTRSSCGTDKLNELIRNKFNKKNIEDMKYKNCKFVVDDRVMCIKNNKGKELDKNGDIVNGVFNGDCGTVKEIDLENNLTTIEFDDGKTGDFSVEELSEFVFAYAITIHKSQGSEYKAVILTLTTEHYVMLQRNLLYTAVTRAKDRVDLFGMKKAFNMAVRNTDYKLRNSKLRHMILALVNSTDASDSKLVKELKGVYVKHYADVIHKKQEMNYYKE